MSLIQPTIAQCSHENKEQRRRVYHNGTTAVVVQCLQCGVQVSAVPKHKWPLPSSLPNFDETLIQKHREWMRKGFQDQREKESQEWWAWYTSYLKTDKWKAIRAKVLQRDKYQCQGCLSNRATQVHHLTYLHAGNEMLFELVAICDACHEFIHPKSEEEDQ